MYVYHQPEMGVSVVDQSLRIHRYTTSWSTNWMVPPVMWMLVDLHQWTYPLTIVISCYIMLYHVISCHIMLYQLILCYIMLYHVISCYIMIYHVISCYIFHKTAFSWNHSLTAVCDAGGRGLRDALTLSGRGWAMGKKTREKPGGFVVGTFQKKGNAWWQDDNKNQ